MPRVVHLFDTIDKVVVERDAADALEMLRQPDGRYTMSAPLDVRPLAAPRAVEPERPDGPPKVDAPYVPPSERAEAAPDPAFTVKGTKRPLTARGLARRNTAKAKAAGAKALKRKATLEAKNAAKAAPVSSEATAS